jgi:hypothetical protein
LYEYLANHIPIIINNNPLWHSICQKYNASVNIDFGKFNVEELLMALFKVNFYSETPGEEILWDSQEHLLIALLNKYKD